MNRDYDCVVLGAGPSGSTAATLVAQAGFSTLLVEREKMPRFHVGESLMPDTYWTLKRLGVWEKLHQADFVKKYSVQFVSGDGRESEPFFFREHDPRECSQTWQVERARFDHLLFEHARESGAECRDQTRVLSVLFEGDRAVGVELRGPDGIPRQVRSNVVIDATGQRSLLATQLGCRVPIPELQKAAIWTYYRGAERLPDEHGGATLVLHTRSREAWFWYIPLADDITSIGLVSDAERLFRDAMSPSDAFLADYAECPALQRRIATAEQVDEFHVAKEYSYTTARHAGDGWVLVGDAFGFIDPIYSSGVFFALKTGEMAADCVVEGLRRGDTSDAQLGRWTDEFKLGARWVRKLVDAFYTNSFSFAKFMREHPEHRGHVTDILIGRVFGQNKEQVFVDMDAAIRESRNEATLAKSTFAKA